MLAPADFKGFEDILKEGELLRLILPLESVEFSTAER